MFKIAKLCSENLLNTRPEFISKCLPQITQQNIFFPNAFTVFLTRNFTVTAVNLDKKPAKDEKKRSENLSFIYGIFLGNVEHREMFPYPTVLTKDQLENIQLLVDPFTKFLKENLNSAKFDAQSKFDDKFLEDLWHTGVFGLQVEPELGGLGLTNTQVARLVQVSGACDLALSVMIGAHQSIGFKGILLFGTPEQKKKYLPLVSIGRKYAAFCLTEPTAGSDAGSVRTRAVLSPDGKHYILNGSKIWITNGGFAEIMTVFAKTPTKNLKTGKEEDQMSAFIVERSFGGVTSGAPESKMGINASNTTEVFFEDVRVPVENILGKPGEGFKIAMKILNNGRFGMVGGLSGTMKTCIKKAVDFATTRTQFGKRIDSYGMIQEKIGRMAMLQYVTESLAFMLSGNMDRGSKDYHLEAAICKCFSSEAAWTVCDEAIQIMGGMGYMKHSELERFMRDIRIFKIFEGTNEILRLLVALSGMKYVGAHLKELQEALKRPAGNIGLILEEVKNRAARKVGLKGPPPMAKYVHPDLERSANLIAKAINRFYGANEQILIKHGKSIIDQQFILSRIADCVLDIYTSAVVLSRASKSLQEKLPSAEYEKIIARIWCQERYTRVRQNLRLVSPKQSKLFVQLSAVSKQVCDFGGIVQLSPLNF